MAEGVLGVRIARMTFRSGAGETSRGTTNIIYEDNFVLHAWAEAGCACFRRETENLKNCVHS